MTIILDVFFNGQGPCYDLNIIMLLGRYKDAANHNDQ